MNSTNELTVPKWPFFLADGFFVAAAGLALWFAPDPVGPGTVAAVVLLLLVGALLSLIPYLLEFYWNWRFFQDESEERVEKQRQALARTGAEIGEIVRRWEEATRQVNSAGLDADLSDPIAEITRAVQQFEAALGNEREKSAEEIKSLFREEREALRRERDRLGKTIARLEAWNEARERSTADEEEQKAPSVVADKPEPPPSRPAPSSDGEAESAVGEATGGAAIAVEEPKPSTAVAEESLPASPRPKKAAKPRVSQEKAGSLFSTTTVVATAFIGASNKLFLRGDGPGLSWDEGVPMQFVEIGKWSWTTTDASGPIRLQVLKNDEVKDKAGVLTLEPGQRLDIRPEFEG